MSFICHSCLKRLNTDISYCNKCSKALFSDNKRMSLILDFDKKEFIETRKKFSDKLSISGYQDKILIRIENSKLIPTIHNGTYILKPIPSQEGTPFDFLSDLPANEHLTMHLASRFFNIQTAENAVIYFSDNEPAYITKRFDYTESGAKLAQEDFCQLLNISKENRGENYKYDFSYEKAVEVIKNYCKSEINIEKYFRMIIFSYIFSNGDLHLKNFSLLESLNGDFILSPAYDLLSTSLHLPQDSRTALDFFEEFESSYYLDNGFYGYDDFMELSRRFEIPEKRTIDFLNSFKTQKKEIIEMIEDSFLSDEGKVRYISLFKDRLRVLEQT